MDSSHALDEMLNSRAVHGQRFGEPVTIPPDRFEGTIEFTDCQFADFRAQVVQVLSPVKFTNCTFENVDFHGTYFHGGFSMDRCIVEGRLGFECGGHNDHGEFALVDSQFNGLVDFEDCWFTGDFRLQNVEFRSGSNLLGNKETPVAVTFDVAPRMLGVTGRLDCNTYT